MSHLHFQSSLCSLPPTCLFPLCMSHHSGAALKALLLMSSITDQHQLKRPQFCYLFLVLGMPSTQKGFLFHYCLHENQSTRFQNPPPAGCCLSWALWRPGVLDRTQRRRFGANNNLQPVRVQGLLQAPKHKSIIIWGAASLFCLLSDNMCRRES